MEYDTEKEEVEKEVQCLLLTVIFKACFTCFPMCCFHLWKVVIHRYVQKKNKILNWPDSSCFYSRYTAAQNSPEQWKLTVKFTVSDRLIISSVTGTIVTVQLSSEKTLKHTGISPSLSSVKLPYNLQVTDCP